LLKKALDKLMEELDGMSGQDRNFDEKMSLLIEEVNAHIDKEEEQIFDEARKNMSEYRLEELGLEIEDRRRMLTLMAA
jgi:hemerythrin-like domain-containing protein